jgi:hypothetical protein
MARKPSAMGNRTAVFWSPEAGSTAMGRAKTVRVNRVIRADMVDLLRASK